MSGLEIAIVAIFLSMLLWALLTHRESAADVPWVMRIPVPWVFVLTYLIGVGLQLAVPIHVPSARVLRVGWVVGLVVVGLGVLLAISALGLFRRARTTTIPFETPSKLVTSGPYRVSRNPMYWGLTLVYLGVAGTQGQVWPLILLPAVLIYLDRVVIPVEERHLLQVFGDDYRELCMRVRRWL